MKKIFLLTLLLGPTSSVFCFSFFKRPVTDGTVASGIPSPSAPTAGSKWMQVVVTPEIINFIDSSEWTSMLWVDFKKVSRIFALSAKPYRKHPFAVKVRTRKILQEIMKHNVWISRWVLETIPAQVPLIIDGQKFVIAYDSQLADLLFSLVSQY